MSVIDLDQLARAAADEAARRVVAELPRLIDEALARAQEKPQPLASILGCSTKAAHSRIARDPGLAAVGILVGRRRLFAASTVRAYFAARGGAR